MKLTMQKDECIMCSQQITNPICAKCNFHHFVLWLNDQSIPLKIRTSIIRKIKTRLFKENTNKLNCIICNENEVSICSYCFFKKIGHILEFSEGISSQNIEDFELSFGHEVYSDYLIIPQDLFMALK